MFYKIVRMTAEDAEESRRRMYKLMQCMMEC